MDKYKEIVVEKYKEIVKNVYDLKRYNCDIEITEDEDAVYLTTKESKSGEFVKWSDIKKILQIIEK